jgi:hypothetical protein
MKYPLIKFELFKTIDSVESLRGSDITDWIDLNSVDGIEATKDVCTFRVHNIYNKLGSWLSPVTLREQSSNRFRIDDSFRLYGYYSSLPTNQDDALLFRGVIRSWDYNTDGDNGAILSFRTINQTEELLGTLSPYSSRSDEGSFNTAPLAICQLGSRLNKFNPNHPIYAYLTTQINPYTGSYGNVAGMRSDGTNFPTIDYNNTWKPVYLQIEQLSSPEYTKDEQAGTYIFYIKNSAVHPFYQKKLGPTIQELVWKAKPLSPTGSYVEGINIVNYKISLDTRDVKNLLIVNAGTDLRGAGITGVAYNTISMGEFGPRSDYYSNSARTFSELHRIEINRGTELGSDFLANGFPPEPGSFPWTMSFSDRDSIGSSNGVVLIATNQKEWNQYLRDEARDRAVIEATNIIQRLGEPRFSITFDLVTGSNDQVLGDIKTFIIPSLGWLGTTANPGRKLRLTEQQHVFGLNGWQTTITALEDEKVIKDLLNT